MKRNGKLAICLRYTARRIACSVAILPFAMMLAPQLWALGGINTSPGAPVTAPTSGSASAAPASSAAVNLPAAETARSYTALAGASIFKGRAGAALAVRAELPHGFQVEAGGVLPANVSGLAEDRASVNTPTPTPLTGQVTNLSQADLALLYPCYKREGFSLEAGVGLSVAQVTSQSEWTTNAGTPEAQAFQDRTLQSAISPLVELGGNYRLTPHLSIHLDVAYLTYSNKVRTPVGQPLALSFRGLAVRPMLAWRF